MVKSLPTLVKSYDECILDITVYGNVVSLPQPSEEELKKILFEEFKQRKPIPTLESKRYELSRRVSSDYRIVYTRELELKTNEYLLDLKSNRDSHYEAVDFSSLSSLVDDAKKLFVYDLDMHDIDREEIISKYDLETGDDLKLGVSDVERTFGSTVLADDLVLSDEQISTLGVEEQVLLEDEPDWGSGTGVSAEDSSDLQFVDEDDEDDIEYEDVMQESDYSEQELVDEDDEDDIEYEDVGYNGSDDESDIEYEDVGYGDGDSYDDDTAFESADVDDEDGIEYEDVGYSGIEDEDDIEYEDVGVGDMGYSEQGFNPQVLDEPAFGTVVTPTEVSAQLDDTDINLDTLLAEISSEKEVIKEESKVSEPEPTDLRAFLRKHPRSEMDFVLKYFTKKQINDALRVGKIIKKGSILRI